MPSDTAIAYVVSGVCLAVYAALVITALMQVFRSGSLKEVSRILWIVGIVIFPIIGSLAWFALGHRTPRSERAASTLRGRL